MSGEQITVLIAEVDAELHELLDDVEARLLLIEQDLAGQHPGAGTEARADEHGWLTRLARKIREFIGGIEP